MKRKIWGYISLLLVFIICITFTSCIWPFVKKDPNVVEFQYGTYIAYSENFMLVYTLYDSISLPDYTPMAYIEMNGKKIIAGRDNIGSINKSSIFEIGKERINYYKDISELYYYKDICWGALYIIDGIYTFETSSSNFDWWPEDLILTFEPIEMDWPPSDLITYDEYLELMKSETTAQETQTDMH